MTAGDLSVFVQDQMQVEPGPGECCKCVPVYAGTKNHTFYQQASFYVKRVQLVTRLSVVWIADYWCIKEQESLANANVKRATAVHV